MGVMDLIRARWPFDWKVRKATAERLANQSLLVKIARGDRNHIVRAAAVKRLEEQVIIAEIALKDKDPVVRKAALERLEDQATIGKIARRLHEATDLRLAAAEKMTDRASAQGVYSVMAIDRQSYIEHEVRLALVGKLEDQALLAEVVLNGRGWEVPKVALARLIDSTLLAEVALKSGDSELGQEAVARIEDQALLAEVGKNAEKPKVRGAAVERVVDQEVLAEIAHQDREGDVSSAAVRRLENQALIVEIVKNHKNRSVRKAAVWNLKDQLVLAEIAKNNEDRGLRAAAVHRLEDQELIAEIAMSDEELEVRQAAVEKLENEAVLAEVAISEKVDYLRRKAVERLDDVALPGLARSIVSSMGIASYEDSPEADEITWETSEVLQEAARLSQDASTYRRGAAQLRALICEYPKCAAPYYLLAFALDAQDEHEEAEQLLLGASKEVRKSSQLASYLGDHYFSHGKQGGLAAVEWYSKSVVSQDEDPIWWSPYLYLSGMCNEVSLYAESRALSSAADRIYGHEGVQIGNHWSSKCESLVHSSGERLFRAVLELIFEEHLGQLKALKKEP